MKRIPRTKKEAVELFGSTHSDLAKVLGITREAVTMWPEQLNQAQIDRVVGAAVRHGLRFRRETQPAS